LEALAHNQALPSFRSSSIFRIPPLQGLFQRNRRSVDESRHRPGPLVHRRPLSTSVVAHGGIFAWKDGRETPDTFQALLEYPKGFLVSYATSFGNDAPSFSRYMGKKSTLFNLGGEGSPRYQFIEEKGNHEDNPDVDKQRKERFLLLPDNALPPMGIDDMSTGHMSNWFDCVRSRHQRWPPFATASRNRWPA